jgi:hypothetical protein
MVHKTDLVMFFRIWSAAFAKEVVLLSFNFGNYCIFCLSGKCI